jgi:hypothetical protein
MSGAFGALLLAGFSRIRKIIRSFENPGYRDAGIDTGK